MRKLNKKWEILVIHHSHTDIGYTERQELIESYHIDFLEQAIEISERIAAGEKELEGFRWTCEGFWAVERFLECADNSMKQRLIDAVHRGHIEITVNYLNLNELIGAQVLKNVTSRSTDFAKEIGKPMDCAITADINGYSWGYSQMLYDIGVRNFASCVHTHHGMFVGEAKQRPFYWETPNGDRILVWMGDHYTLGNELGIVPDALYHYMIKDEFNYNNAPFNSDKRFEIGEKRVERYLSNLEDEDYPYSFVPVMVSGLVTDNAPPNPKIMEHIHKWNKIYGDEVEIKMVSLDEFFEKLQTETAEIPVYRGDWPDWWADGLSSTPLPVKMFREAQRMLQVTRMMDPNETLSNQELIKKAEDLMMVYCEHTWGYSASISEPWTNMVHVTDYRNIGYANGAHEAVYRNFDQLLRKKGRASFYPGRPMIYRIENPYDTQVSELVRLYVDGTEKDLISDGFKVIDITTGEELDKQVDLVARGTEVCVFVDMDAKSETTLEIVADSIVIDRTESSYQLGGSDGVVDIVNGDDCKGLNISETSIESDTIKIQWSNEGIYSWYDKINNVELIRDSRDYNAFTPIHEITKTANEPNAQMDVRRTMGRNRNGINVSRDWGKVIGVKNKKTGDVFAQIELEYGVSGTVFYSMLITVYNNTAKVDISIRMNKTNEWSPENLYLSLPFDVQKSEFWIEKAGSILRPRIDQVHRSNRDFYCVQEGIGWISKDYGVAVGIPDTPLIKMGSLQHRAIQLHDMNDAKGNDEQVYVWMMNNYWETNFKASLGEIYGFDFYVDCGKHITDSSALGNHCIKMNAGTINYRIDK